MRRDIPNIQVTTLIEKVRRLPQVRNIEYVPPEGALKKLEKDLNIDLTMNPTDNPLPPALIIRVQDARHIRQVADQVGQMKGVEDLKYGETVLQRVLAISIAIKFIGFALTVLMGIATLFTIMNTIRLTVVARRKEIRTMQLVGATGWFIRWPFLLEGIFFGLTGAVLSAAILSGGYYFFSTRLQTALPFLLPIVDELIMLKALFIFLCLCGFLMGVAGSYISVTKFLADET
ncbi:MAG: permease-like cell division protein FtsX, partial [bacterium]